MAHSTTDCGTRQCVRKKKCDTVWHTRRDVTLTIRKSSKDEIHQFWGPNKLIFGVQFLSFLGGSDPPKFDKIWGSRPLPKTKKTSFFQWFFGGSSVVFTPPKSAFFCRQGIRHLEGGSKIDFLEQKIVILYIKYTLKKCM